MKTILILPILFLITGCSLNQSFTKQDVDLIRTHYYIKNQNCHYGCPDKIDEWQYRIYAPYLQNCYEKEE